MLKGIKKKWTDITIALALPLVIWNGATGSITNGKKCKMRKMFQG